MAARRLERLRTFCCNRRFSVTYLNRFISADTIVPDPTNPQSFNRYSYTNNNPINYVDPSGHAAQLIEGGDGNCQNSLDCVYWDNEIHGELYGRPIGTKLEDVAQAKEQMGATGQVALAMACELCDWAMTGNAWRQGDFHWMDLAGLLPIVPGAAGRLARQSDTLGDIFKYGEDILGNKSVFESLTNGQKLATDEILEQGQQFVGHNALEVDPGVFISSSPVEGSDIYARFHITDNDILGTHGGGPHANFELVQRVVDPSTGRVRYQSINMNKHIYFSDIP